MKNLRKKSLDSESDGQEVQNFLLQMEQAFARHPLWAGASREEIDAAVEVRCC